MQLVPPPCVQVLLPHIPCCFGRIMREREKREEPVYVVEVHTGGRRAQDRV